MNNKTLSNFGNIFEYKNAYLRLIKDNIVPNIKSIIANKPYDYIKSVRATGFHKIDGVDCFLTSDSAVDKYMNTFVGGSFLKGKLLENNIITRV